MPTRAELPAAQPAPAGQQAYQEGAGADRGATRSPAPRGHAARRRARGRVAAPHRGARHPAGQRRPAVRARLAQVRRAVSRRHGPGGSSRLLALADDRQGDVREQSPLPVAGAAFTARPARLAAALAAGATGVARRPPRALLGASLEQRQPHSPCLPSGAVRGADRATGRAVPRSLRVRRRLRQHVPALLPVGIFGPLRDLRSAPVQCPAGVLPGIARPPAGRRRAAPGSRQRRRVRFGSGGPRAGARLGGCEPGAVRGHVVPE